MKTRSKLPALRKRPEVAPGVLCVHQSMKYAYLDLSDAEWEQEHAATTEFRKRITQLRAEIELYERLKTDGKDVYVTF